jgi:class 3 adenylate cyclase
MAAEVKKEIELEVAPVLFIDIVGYSKLSINEQRAVVDELTQVVRATEQFHKAEASDRLIRIATGDGMALVFYTSPEAPVRCAIELSRALKDHPRLRVRMGIHSGPVSGGHRCNWSSEPHWRRFESGAPGDELRRCGPHPALQTCR